MYKKRAFVFVIYNEKSYILTFWRLDSLESFVTIILLLYVLEGSVEFVRNVSDKYHFFYKFVNEKLKYISSKINSI